MSLRSRAGDYEWYARPAAGARYALIRDPRAKRVWFALPDRLVAAWYVELFANGPGNHGTDAAGYVISAEDGSLLFRNTLTASDAAAETYSYRVFADADGINQPFDSPLGNGYDPFPASAPNAAIGRVSATANLVTLRNSQGVKSGDPWLPAGATTTTGNHVDAFLDTGLILGLSGTSTVTDGYQAGTGDLRTTTTAPNTFDYAIRGDDNPAQASPKNAAIVNLFYMNNWLHDFWYNHGFDEAAGNAQTSNYGRGGVEGDPISAQGQDASGRDNANMSTPADGSSPRMQMYLFDGSISGTVAVTDPAGFSPFVFSIASFGPTSFDVTAPAAFANETGGASATDGCGSVPALPITGTTPAAAPDLNLRGKIALIDRGGCPFTTKEQFATASGAVAMVVVQNDPTANPITMGNADVPTLPINIPINTSTLYNTPAVMIRKDDGDRVRALLAAGTPVTMHVKRDVSIDYDGTLDNQIIAHEYFHYVSNRLVGDGSGLSNQQGGGMGEGWSDFDALLLTLRAEDLDVPGNFNFGGSYPLAYYVTASFSPQYFYYGIRRQPYSKDFAHNSLTFKHIQDGTPLDTTAPTSFGGDGASNSEVHNTGEVWAEMLFECYTNILNNGEGTFAERRGRMQDYIIAGLKMTPSQPTILEARDGVLAAAFATNYNDFAACARGFAKRGAGVFAKGPDRTSTDNVGVTESTKALISTLTLTVASITVDPTTDCDRDGVLDGGETGLLSLTLRNDGTYQDGAPVTATVTSALASAGFGNGGVIRFAAPALGASVTSTIPVQIARNSAIDAPLPIALSFDRVAGGDPAVEQPAAQSALLYVNYDVTPNQRDRDDLSQPGASLADWTRSGTGGSWQIADMNATLNSGNVWFGADPATRSDFSLTTPSFTVPAAGSFTMTFDHYYEFEPSTTTGLLPFNRVTKGNDGGVIEVSIDGAAFVDVTAAGATFSGGNGYNGQLLALDANGGRQGFVGTNGAVETLNVNFGTRLAGHSVRLRFREASNDSVGGVGWSIDNIKLTGAMPAAFSSALTEDGVCLGATTGGTTGGSTTGSTTGGTTGSTTGGTTTGGTTGSTTGGSTTGGTTGGTTTGGTTGGTTTGSTTGGTTGGTTTGGTTGSTTGGTTGGTTTGGTTGSTTGGTTGGTTTGGTTTGGTTTGGTTTGGTTTGGGSTGGSTTGGTSGGTTTGGTQGSTTSGSTTGGSTTGGSTTGASTGGSTGANSPGSRLGGSWSGAGLLVLAGFAALRRRRTGLSRAA